MRRRCVLCCDPRRGKELARAEQGYLAKMCVPPHRWPFRAIQYAALEVRAISHLSHLPAKGVNLAIAQTPADSAEWHGGTLEEALREPERRILLAALEANAWSRQKTSEQLGINRTTLYKKMKQYGLLGDERLAG